MRETKLTLLGLREPNADVIVENKSQAQRGLNANDSSLSPLILGIISIKLWQRIHQHFI